MHSSDIMWICSARKGFTVEDRYLPLPTLTTLKVLHLAKKEIHGLTAAHCARYNIFDLSQLDYQASAGWSVAGVHYLIW